MQQNHDFGKPVKVRPIKLRVAAGACRKPFWDRFGTIIKEFWDLLGTPWATNALVRRGQVGCREAKTMFRTLNLQVWRRWREQCPMPLHM